MAAASGSSMNRSAASRIRGTLFGTAIGDALGGPRQFTERDELPLLTEMKPIANFKVPAGTWSDDTSMTLCLAESLTKTGTGEQDPADQLTLYSCWLSEGHNTPTGKAFDIGGTTRNSIQRYRVTGEVRANTDDEVFQGNGSLMRVAPVAAMFRADPARAGREAAISSLTTHSNLLCQQACQILGQVIATALQGGTKEEVLGAVGMSGYLSPLEPVVKGRFAYKSRDQIQSDGWVVATLEAALWAFARTETFEDGAIYAVNLAHDADTVGAVYGAIAGAFYGYEAIPDRWLAALKGRDVIEKVCGPFLAVCGAA